jgi:heme/copper-type cytochrome/quinol oxidase subunit 2
LLFYTFFFIFRVASNIETLSSMRSRLLARELNLYDLLSTKIPDEDNLASILTITLIVVSVVLGALVAILLVAFVVKTRG